MSRFALFCGLVLAFMLGRSATAVAADIHSDSAQLQEVVVSAQRRSQPLKDVPMTVTQLSAQSLLKSNAVSLQDWAQRVPGVIFYPSGYGAGMVVIRGVVTGFGTTPTVSYYLDDTPIGSSVVLGSAINPFLPDVDPSDLQRIEVLKGPQGTLWGASSMGGLIRYVTIPPDLTRFKARAELDGSTVSHGGQGYGVRGRVNLPFISDRLAMTLSVMHRRDPGYVDNIAPGGQRDGNWVNSTNVELSLLWRPVDAVTVRLSAVEQDRQGNGTPLIDYDFSTRALVPLYGDLLQKRIPNADRNHDRLALYSATVDWDLGPATLTSSTSYGATPFYKRTDYSGLFAARFEKALGVPDLGTISVINNDTKKFTQELRLASNARENEAAGDIDWIAGLYYTDEKSNFNTLLLPIRTTDGGLIASLPFLINQIGQSTYREVAGFGDITYYLTPKFTAQAGVRYSDSSEHALQTSPQSSLSPATVTPGGASGKVATYLFSPEYKLTPNTTFYARFATGYRAGGPNLVIPIAGFNAPPQFNSDKTLDYEVGAKSFLLQRGVYVEANAFDIDWNNIQLQAITPAGSNYVTNASSAVIRGAELDGEYHPLDRLTFSADAAYTDAHLTANAPSAVFAPSGSKLPYTPQWSGHVSVDYAQPLGAVWTADVSAAMSYLGTRVSDFTPSAKVPRVQLPSYTLVDLQATFSNDRYSIGLFAKNIFDKRGFLTAKFETPDMLHDYGVVVTQPRTIGIRLTASY